MVAESVSQADLETKFVGCRPKAVRIPLGVLIAGRIDLARGVEQLRHACNAGSVEGRNSGDYVDRLHISVHIQPPRAGRADTFFMNSPGGFFGGETGCL